MQFFGVPKCPYCKKRVNFIRTWSLKRQGEYKCPRCQGISNIYLSPLTHVFAVVAVFASGILYFFHRFILNDITVSTVLKVFLPFAIFYFLSLFMVYLEKPVIKKKPSKKRRAAAGAAQAAQQRPMPRRDVETFTGDDLFHEEHNVPNLSGPQVTGPVYQDNGQNRRQARPNVLNRTPPPRSGVRPSVQQRPSARPQPRPVGAPPANRPAVIEDANYVRQEKPATQKSIEVTMPISPRKPQDTPAQGTDFQRVVQKIEIGSDFFQKYEDPDYVNKRIEEEE